MGVRLDGAGELAALRDLAARALPGSGALTVEHTATGVSTPVYRIRRNGTTLYLRLAETPEASLAPEVSVHNALRARGVRAPEVIHFELFNDVLQRSVMITTEIPGIPISQSEPGEDVASVLTAAGRDLAVINTIGVNGFGWIRRDRDSPDRLEAELPSLRAFALGDLEAHLTVVRPFLTGDEVDEVRRVIARFETSLDADHAVLAHGDFDATHIFHRNGEYTGVIDFGEIRGADPFYDLGHFALHDGETIPAPLLPYLLSGYCEVTPLPPDHEHRIRLWSVLIGVRALARSANRPRSGYQDFLAAAIRRALIALST